MFAKIISCSLFILQTTDALQAQVIYTSTVREIGIAGSPIAFSTEASTTSNPSFIPKKNELLLSAFIVNNYNMAELNSYSLYYQNKIGNHQRLTVAINNTGNKNFSQKQADIAIGKIIGKIITAGLKLSFIQSSIKDKYYKNNYTITPDVALNLNPLKNIYIGVLVRNPVRSRMNANEKRSLPTEIFSGISYLISRKLTFHANLKQRSDELPSFQSGIEYLYNEHLTIRTGYQTEPISQSLGFSLKIPPFKFELSVASHPFLGFTSGAGIFFTL